MIYVIYINNHQFTCLIGEIEKEKNIPSILGFPDLNFLKKEKNGEYIKIFYELKELIKVKIHLNKKPILEKSLPISISLNRLRDLLSNKIKNFFFCCDKAIIQPLDESSFCLKDIIKNDFLYLNDNEFNFVDENESQNVNDDKINLVKEEKVSITKDINDTIENENNKLKCQEIKSSDIQITKEEKDKIDIVNQKEHSSENFSEMEYKLCNNNSSFGIIKICPEITLNELREKIINLIPRRSLFLMKDEKIQPSKEKSVLVKNIAENDIIKFEIPIEDKNEPIELEIYLNEKLYIKKEFYIKIKLKNVRINLKFDKTYKFVFKEKILSDDEENKMTLDEYCDKEFKIFFIKLKGNFDDDTKLSTISIKKNTKIDTKIYKKVFDNNEYFEHWIIFGKEKSGKTTFINCLFNYLMKVKYEDNFRYSIEAQKRNNYEIYDLQGFTSSKYTRIIEFLGFSGELEEDKKISKTIKNFIRTLKEVKAILFVISGNETRLTDSLRHIFSYIWNIFAVDILQNFYFIVTNCDAKNPPVVDCIKSSPLSKLPIENLIFQFNNSYLYEINQEDFWNIGISHYDDLVNNINQKNNITLNITKSILDFNFAQESKNYIISLENIYNNTYYYNIIKNISSYDNKSNINIPFNYFVSCKICSKCNNEIKSNYNYNCDYCGCYIFKDYQRPQNKVTLQQLKMYKQLNSELYFKCLKYYKNDLRTVKINSANNFKLLEDFYNSQLINSSTLENDLIEMLDKKASNFSSLTQEINNHKILYNKYISEKNSCKYQTFLNKMININ